MAYFYEIRSADNTLPQLAGTGAQADGGMPKVAIDKEGTIWF